MKTPYKDEIRYLKENIIDRIEEVDYITADESFDKLGLLYCKQCALLSRELEEEKEKGQELEIILEILSQFFSTMKDWRQIIDMQAKWGTIR